MTTFCPRCGSMIFPFSEKCSSCGWSPNEPEGTVQIRPKIQPKVLNEEDPKLPFFPYKPRDIQKEIVRDIVEALDAEKHIVVESGTGTGKTIVSLSSVLDHSFRHGKKVLYITRTITQSDQVMRELRAISNIRKVTGITITGRGRSCPYLRTLPNQENIHPAVLKNICEEGKRKADSGNGGCKFYSMMKARLVEVEEFCRRSLPTSEEIDKYCESIGVCPYEAKKSILRDMDVIVAPYVHLLSEDIRNNFLGSIERDATNVCLIVDEAHNLIDAAREQESYSIPMTLINAALDEMTTMKGDPPLFENVLLGPFISEVKNIVRSLANEKLSFTKKEEIIGSTELQDRLKKRFELNDSELNLALERMIDLGSDRTELLMEKGENRVSDIYTLGESIMDLVTSGKDKYIKSIKATDDGEVLHAACIDPFDVTLFIRNIKSAVHMSGTLQPLEQYVKVMALPSGTVSKTYPSPFPKENRSVLYVSDVTTRYEDMMRDPTMKTRIRRYIIRLCNNVNKNTLVFFPSYHLMSEMRPFLERDIQKELYWEEQRNPRRTADNLIRFRKGRNGVFFTVMGGTIAEGIDFPGEELCFSILVGIPFPPPTLENKAMSKMFDDRYGAGTGWRYTSEVPAIRKIQQAVGRMIRTETDRGMAVILDSRASKYAKRLDAQPTQDPVGDAVKFFEMTG